MLGKINDTTTRSGILEVLDLPPEYTIHPSKRTQEEQTELVQWGAAAKKLLLQN
jgi:hypothetical protein